MLKAIKAFARTLMITESEWNPKVMLGRALVAVVPERVLHPAKKIYYSYLFQHVPPSWGENDSVCVRALVQAGDTVIDIGASIGNYTKFLATLVGPSGQVHSFEPNPNIYNFLSHNVRKVRLANVKLYRCALSDKAGNASIAIPRYRWGSECHYDATLEHNRAAADCRQIEVVVTTLDTLFAHGTEKIAFIKCDVNYHELACLRGSLQTIRRCKPALLVEVLPSPDHPGSQAAQLFELLQGEGYEAYCFDGRCLHKRRYGERSQNYFFLTRQHEERLPPVTSCQAIQHLG